MRSLTDLGTGRRPRQAFLLGGATASYGVTMHGASRDALVASDRRYFESGAVNEPVGPATLSWVSGLTHLAAGCVVHSVDPQAIDDAPAWVAAVRSAVEERGAPRVRIYVDPGPALRAALEGAGLTPRAETAFVTRGRADCAADGVALHDLAPDDDRAWDAVGELHRVGGVGSGIYPEPPDDWTDLMRRRCRSGGMEGFIVSHHDEPCGSVGVLVVDGLMRSKNILIGRGFRRQGIGRGVLHHLWERARQRGCDSLGAFAVPGTPGAGLYPAAGLTAVGEQVEWATAGDRVPA